MKKRLKNIDSQINYGSDADDTPQPKRKPSRLRLEIQSYGMIDDPYLIHIPSNNS